MDPRGQGPVATIEKAPVYALADQARDSAKTLDKLLRQNHAAHAVLREPRMIFHNHIPHALGSSYLLGASSDQLDVIYATELPHLISTGAGLPRDAITRDTWRDCWGQKKFTAAFVDFFDSEIERHGGDWSKVVDEYLYSGDKPLLDGFFCGLGHPAIHLAYGFEFQSKQVVSEALSLACTECNDVYHRLAAVPPVRSPYKTKQLSEVLLKVHQDRRFDGFASHPGPANLTALLRDFEPAILEHWHALDVDDADAQFRAWMHAAALLATTTADAQGGFDFFLAHVLTAGHALRILLPLMPAARRLGVLRQYGLFAILTYLSQLRPAMALDKFQSPGSAGGADDWATIDGNALASKWFTDLHWPKVVRALRMVEDLHGGGTGTYRLAAMDFVARFSGWTGFGQGVGDSE